MLTLGNNHVQLLASMNLSTGASGHQGVNAYSSVLTAALHLQHIVRMENAHYILCFRLLCISIDTMQLQSRERDFSAYTPANFSLV